MTSCVRFSDRGFVVLDSFPAISSVLWVLVFEHLMAICGIGIRSPSSLGGICGIHFGRVCLLGVVLGFEMLMSVHRESLQVGTGLFWKALCGDG